MILLCLRQQLALLRALASWLGDGWASEPPRPCPLLSSGLLPRASQYGGCRLPRRGGLIVASVYLETGSGYGGANIGISNMIGRILRAIL